jgi:glycosyltransferase involved in cell wall biosynthesis
VEPRKNLEAIVRALPALDNARLVAVGPPTPYQQQCQALAVELGVAGRLEFLGYVDRDELLELYATCGVVAVASHYEGFGYAAAQALCAGTPCVVADRSALPEIVGKDARIVPIDSTQSWIDALGAALNGDDDERSAQARSRAIERYSWSATARKMQEVYAQAIS